MKMRLYEIEQDMSALDDLLMEVEGDVSDPEVVEFVESLFEENDKNFKQKVENYCGLIREYLNLADSAKAEAKRMEKLAKTRENAAKGLKERLQYHLDHMQIDKVVTDRFRVSVGNNGGKLPLHVDEWAVPDNYKKAELKVDNQKIRQALEAGEDLDFATFKPRGRRLNIK